MKALIAFVLASIMVSFSILISTTCAYTEPSVGVKEGDWMEYDINITGVPPPIHNVTWMRMEVLQVEGPAFPANVTVRFLNGTLYSSIWKFNFTEGNTEGWIIIPSNLGPKDTFYDNFSKTDKNVAVQSQTQRTVLGASRAVTCGNDSFRTKEWDKATGVFVRSSETLKNWSADVEMVATNLWSPQFLGLNQEVFYKLTASGVVLAAVISFSVVVVMRRKRSQTL